MTAELTTLLGEMEQRLTPDDAQRGALQRAVDALVAKARAVGEAMGTAGAPAFEPLLVGSAAKDTWIPGHVDLDVFLLFPPDVPRATLEEAGLRAGKQILSDDWRLRYAEHPYVHGVFQGFDADVVPAYRVTDATQILSAVDRTPFHNAWVQAALTKRPERKHDIRLAKAWLRGIGAYGAETALAGFSGYLTEVLVLHLDGFLPLLKSLSGLEPGARIDPSGGSPASFPDATLVLIDPVDPRRNAAAAVSLPQLERVRRAARAFMERPSMRFFEPLPLPPLSPERARALLGPAGLALVVFPVPEMREDAIVPHVARAAESLGTLLAREGFEVTRTQGGLTRDGARAYLLVQTTRAELPAEREHVGPPERIAARADEFRAKYRDHPDVLRGPYTVGVGADARVAVTLAVHERPLAARVQGILDRRVSLGKHVDPAFVRGPVTVLGLDEALREADVREVVAALLSPKEPWDRSGDAAADYAP